MRLEEVSRLREWEFVRLVGVSRMVYGAMVEAVREQTRDFGRPPKLVLADQVLLCLMYWREYRTLAAIGFSYGVSESTAWRIVHKVESALLASGRFALPGKKALHSPSLKNALVLLDATEVPVQRPKRKKNKRASTPARRNDIPSKRKSLSKVSQDG
ncbi:transposase family protein [bacterium]|nr:MAG: transposase family protein [bacterium]